MNKSPRLFQVPQLIIQLIGRLVGKSSEIKRLLGSLRVDNSYTSEILGWSPALSLDESLEKTVRWYLKNR
jgi:UDP-glucose 4-epimerase